MRPGIGEPDSSRDVGITRERRIGKSLERAGVDVWRIARDLNRVAAASGRAVRLGNRGRCAARHGVIATIAGGGEQA